MRFLNLFALVILSAISFSALGAKPNESGNNQRLIHEMVQKYRTSNSLRAECPNPDPTACVEFVCAKMGTFGCNAQNKIIPVVNACSGNFGSSCIETSCNLVAPWGCSSTDRVLAVARACKRNVDGNCLRAVCSHLTNFECDDVQEILPILQSCAGN